MPEDAASLIKSVKTKGFIFCGSYMPDQATEKVAHLFGEPINFGPNSPVHVLTPKSLGQAPPNTYSGNYGLGKFPLHTDMANWHEPPRYLMLRCIVGSPDVATILADPQPIVESIGIHNLARALMKPRRRVSGRISLLPLAQAHGDDVILRWDERYLQPASRAGEIYAFEIDQRLRQVEAMPIVLARSGDTVVIDNWKMFHGRAAVPESGRSRRIERIYLKALAP